MDTIPLSILPVHIGAVAAKIFEISDERDGVTFSGKLSIASYMACLLYCKKHPGSPVRFSGIDITPRDKLIGVSFDFDKKSPLLGLFLNKFLSLCNPNRVRRHKLILVINNFSEAEIRRLITIPKEAVLEIH